MSDNRKAMLGAFRKMASRDAKTDLTPEPQLKRQKGESEVQFEMLRKMLKDNQEVFEDDELKNLKDLR